MKRHRAIIAVRATPSRSPRRAVLPFCWWANAEAGTAIFLILDDLVLPRTRVWGRMWELAVTDDRSGWYCFFGEEARFLDDLNLSPMGREPSYGTDH